MADGGDSEVTKGDNRCSRVADTTKAGSQKWKKYARKESAKTDITVTVTAANNGGWWTKYVTVDGTNRYRVEFVIFACLNQITLGCNYNRITINTTNAH